jgi:hypothetical protein
VHRWTCPPSLAEGSHHRDWLANVGNQFIAAFGGSGRINIEEAITCSLLIDAAKLQRRRRAHDGREKAGPIGAFAVSGRRAL